MMTSNDCFDEFVYVGNIRSGEPRIYLGYQNNRFDKPTILCYSIAVVSNTEYQSYRIARSDCAGKPYRNAERCAGGLCP
ncbi:hypothetical protein DFP97_117120 [Paenibacillus prosopidis]|uniref:Uncharacterized protein n=1 Tax=Paenibacillus prosopidis TaxID=630520 RepID=A0A368VR13_9BACL|nr:hypothetical protein DFP97_117120 [Paenibacillus prosopidis]